MMRREKARDDRDFDQTSLSLGEHGLKVSRDYSAHFFRWSFVRRLVKPSNNVLEVGCGPEKPLSHILFNGPMPCAANYVGVDLNKLPSTGNASRARATYISEFNFVNRWKELSKSGPFDVAVHLEVIEHMLPAHGLKLLKGCRELLKPGGVMVMSTPCYDGVHHAANHIHEYTVPELTIAVKKAGFTVDRRWGTFMDVKHIVKSKPALSELSGAIKAIQAELKDYYDNDALSCFFAPLFPDLSRNNLWVCRRA